MKKIILIGIPVLIAMFFSFLPLISTKMAENGFARPNSASSIDMIENAVKLKLFLYMFPDARKVCEKAMIIVPESANAPYFCYTAALCAEKESMPDVAIYWYGRFMQLFPKHEWYPQAKNSYEKLNALHDGKQK